MQTVLIVIHLMIVLALVVVVLLQKSEGGALGIGGGGGFMAGRSSSNPLSRLTAYLAAGFFATSLSLTIVAGYGGGSVFDRLQPSSATTRPANPTDARVPLGTGQGGILPSLKPTGGPGPQTGAPQVPTGGPAAAAAGPAQPSFEAPPAAETTAPRNAAGPDASTPPQGDSNTPPQGADRQTPGGAQTAPMPQDAQPVAPQVSDPKDAGGNEGVKQAPSQQVAPEGDSKPSGTPSTAGPAAPTGP